MTSSIIEIVAIFVLLAVNALFAMTEIAVVSARRLRLNRFADQGDERARVTLDLHHDASPQSRLVESRRYPRGDLAQDRGQCPLLLPGVRAESRQHRPTEALAQGVVTQVEVIESPDVCHR